jgi:hypothetical protein
MAKLLDEFAKGFGDAVADIREKVVEEPFFGRVVSDRESTVPQWPESREATQGDSFGSLTREQDKAQDLDIDR